MDSNQPFDTGTPPAEPVPPMAPPPMAPEPPKKSNRTTWIIVIVVLVILCCCCVVLAGVGSQWNSIMDTINNSIQTVPY
jgi:hypothetical protein